MYKYANKQRDDRENDDDLNLSEHVNTTMQLKLCSCSRKRHREGLILDKMVIKCCWHVEYLLRSIVGLIQVYCLSGEWQNIETFRARVCAPNSMITICPCRTWRHQRISLEPPVWWRRVGLFELLVCARARVRLRGFTLSVALHAIWTPLKSSAHHRADSRERRIKNSDIPLGEEGERAAVRGA